MFLLEIQKTHFSQGNARILCHPICSGEGDLEAVVEFVRTHGNAFTEDEIEVPFVDILVADVPVVEVELNWLLLAEGEELSDVGRSKSLLC